MVPSPARSVGEAFGKKKDRSIFKFMAYRSNLSLTMKPKVKINLQLFCLFFFLKEMFHTMK